MIKTAHDEFTEICGSCKQPAFAREVIVKSLHNTRRVCYHIHEECMTHDNHTARLKEVDKFFAELDEFHYQLTQMKFEPREGTITEVDVGYIRPDACSSFQKVSIWITVSWNKHSQEFQAANQQFDLDGLDPNSLKAFIVAHAEAEIARMKEQYQLGKLQ